MNIAEIVAAVCDRAATYPAGNGDVWAVEEGRAVEFGEVDEQVDAWRLQYG